MTITLFVLIAGYAFAIGWECCRIKARTSTPARTGADPKFTIIRGGE